MAHKEWDYIVPSSQWIPPERRGSKRVRSPFGSRPFNSELRHSSRSPLGSHLSRSVLDWLRNTWPRRRINLVPILFSSSLRPSRLTPPSASTFLAKRRCNLTQPSRNTPVLPPFESLPSSIGLFVFLFPIPARLPFSSKLSRTMALLVYGAGKEGGYPFFTDPKGSG